MQFRSRPTAVLMTAALASGAAVAAGCGGGSGDGAKGAPTTEAARLTLTTPAATGTVDQVTWALPTGEPTTIDPAKTGDASSSSVVANLCDNLFRIQPDFSTKPGLAEAVEQPDARTMVLKIRDGVTFWDGVKLTAEDVVYSLKRNSDPAVQGVSAGAFMNVASIAASGPLEVTLKLERPDSALLPVLSGVAGAISEKAYATKAGKAYGTPSGGLMCSGPFKLDKWTAGESVAISANPNYWDADLKPKVQHLTFKFIPDSSTLTSALLAGEVDGTYEAPVGSRSALGKSAQGTLYMGPSSASVSFGPTTDTGPAADPKVRRALDLAIDKDAFVKNVLRGAGEPLKTFTPPFVYDGSEAKAVYEQGYAALPDNRKADLDQAKRLIAEAKPAKKTLTIVIAAGSQLELQVATIVQAAARSLGLDMKIKQLQATQFSALFYDASLRKDYDFVATTGYIETPSVLTYAPLFAIKGGLFNWSGYDNPVAARELIAAQSTIDPTKSAEHFVKAQAAYAPDDLQISLAVAYELLFMNKRITGAPASFAYISSPWAARLGAAGGGQ
jgi:peptide/nickel transport system substrate-binding protein